MCWYGEGSCLRQWKQPFMLDRISWRAWRFTMTQTSEIQRLFNITQKFHIGAFWRNSECEYDWKCISLIDEISIVSWSSDPVDKSKSTCLPRFRSMSGKDEWKQRCNYKMGRSSGRIQNVPFFYKNDGNRWRSNWIRVEYFPRIFLMADSSRDPEWFAKVEHRTCNSQTGSSSCQCSTTSIGQRKRWNLYFEFRSQGIRAEILAGTLDVSRSWRRKEVVWNSSRKMGFHSQSHGGTIQRYRSSCIQEYSCFESWNSEEDEWKGHHTLQCGCFEHRALVPNHSFCKSAQYYRSSFELVWTIMPDRGRKRARQTERIRDQRCIDKREMPRSKAFGLFSKTSIWKQFAGKHSGLRITVRDNSIHKGLRTRIFPAQGFSFYKLQNSTWRGRQFWADQSIMSRIHPFSSKPTIQRLCSTSWRNTSWTSHWSSDRETSWPVWTWNCNFITQW